MSDFSIIFFVFDFQKLYHDVFCVDIYIHTHTLHTHYTHTHTHTQHIRTHGLGFIDIILSIVDGVHHFWKRTGWYCSKYSSDPFSIFLDSIYTYNRPFIFFFLSLCFILYIFYWPTFKFTIHLLYSVWFTVKPIYQIINLGYLNFLIVNTF